MIKYVPEDTSVVFLEIPDEICCAINISNCPHRCDGCHSQYLRKDIGDELNKDVIDQLLNKHNGITCVLFMGGDADKDGLSKLADYVRSNNVKSAWYSGEDNLDLDYYKQHYDYIKVGSYKHEFGPLDKRTTNQRLYMITDNHIDDITYKFWK